MGDNMPENIVMEIKLTELQEIILLELSKTNNLPFICKKLNIKPITLTKTTQILSEKEMINETILTEKGKKMVHYLEFRNETISLFLNKYNIPNTSEIYNQLSKLDYRVIVTFKNLI